MQTDQVFDGTHELLCFTWNHLPPEFSVCTISGLLTKLCPTLVTPRDLQAPLSMGFPGQEYWGRLPFSSVGDLPKPGIKPTSPALQAVSPLQVGSLPLSHQGAPITFLMLKSCGIIFFNWSIADLHGSVSFKCTTKQFSYIYYIYIYNIYPSNSFPQVITKFKYSSMCYTVVLVIYFIYSSVCVCVCVCSMQLNFDNQVFPNLLLNKPFQIHEYSI